jgi:hypothetical protein
VRALSTTKRFWLPFAAAALCLLGTRWAGPIVTWLLLFAAIGLLTDGITLLWSRGGNLTQHRQ